jgi:tetraprenyl-beta-curcumene synthase
MTETPDTAIRGTGATKPIARRGTSASANGFSTLTGAGPAFALANLRYWSTVAPEVGLQLSRWEREASAIPDPKLRGMALSKLRNERFNSQLAATLATLAKRPYRRCVTRAIVALEVVYDYLDVLTEQPLPDPVPASRALFTALSDSLSPNEQQRGGEDTGTSHAEDSGTGRAPDYYRHYPHTDDGGYLQALAGTVRTALAELPSSHAILPVARASAQRCVEAQLLHHSSSRAGLPQLRRSATALASGTGLHWQEFLAGASASVLAIHALIAAAADPATTRQDAEEIDSLYLSIGALTMLDSLIDRDEDLAAGQLGYLQYYDDPLELASRLALLARDAVARARTVSNGSHHIMTLVGVVAYYLSAPTAADEFARPLTAPLRRELTPLITPTLALMRAWRLAKRMTSLRGAGR